MKYGIAILPSQKVQQIANSFRKRYDPHYKLIAPHITLREPFVMQSEDEVDALITSLSKVAEATSPFTLSISKFSTFHPVNNVIYLVIDESDDIRSLHQKVQLNESDEERPYSFIPHVTIAQKMDTDELLDVYPGIKMNDVKNEFKVDRFHLFKQGDDMVWSVVNTFELKG